MTYSDKNAVYALNRYVSRLIEVNIGWTTVTYTDADNKTINSSFIVPSAQQPELMTTGKGFMVYGSSLGTPGHLYDHQNETVAYTIYSHSATEVNKIVNLLFDVFKRQDHAVADVNFWLDQERAARGIDRQISFTTLNPTMAEKVEPVDEEGGYTSGMILIDTGYVVTNTTFVTRPGQTGWTTP